MKQYIGNLIFAALMLLVMVVLMAMLFTLQSCHASKLSTALTADSIAFPAHYRALVKALDVDTVEVK